MIFKHDKNDSNNFKNKIPAHGIHTTRKSNWSAKECSKKYILFQWEWLPISARCQTNVMIKLKQKANALKFIKVCIIDLHRFAKMPHLDFLEHNRSCFITLRDEFGWFNFVHPALIRVLKNHLLTQANKIPWESQPQQLLKSLCSTVNKNMHKNTFQILVYDSCKRFNDRSLTLKSRQK